jgi:hypothetical protein
VCACVHTCRDVEESDTASTDPQQSWGGKGKFEYSSKVLPHVLVHIVEILMRAGHHAGACSFLAEVSHKDYIKQAARFARTFNSHNRSEAEMLKWVLTNIIYSESFKVSTSSMESPILPVVEGVDAAVEGEVDPAVITRMCSNPLSFNMMFDPSRSNVVFARWESTMFAKNMRLTRKELLSIVCSKLGFENDTLVDRKKLVCTLHKNQMCVFKNQICVSNPKFTL